MDFTSFYAGGSFEAYEYLGAHLGKCLAHPLTELDRHKDYKRNKGVYYQRKPQIYARKRNEGADKHHAGYEYILRAVMCKLRNIEQVVHESGHHLPRLVLIEERKGELLQMNEHIAAHITLHTHTDNMPPIGNDIVQHRFEGIYQQQHARPHRQQAKVSVRNIVVDNIFCYQRIEHIAHRYEERAQHIEEEKPFVRLIIAYEFLYHANHLRFGKHY